MQRTVPVETTADAYLELLAARGIDHLFGNGGTDFGPIIDAYVRRLTTEQPVPVPVAVPHRAAGPGLPDVAPRGTGRGARVLLLRRPATHDRARDGRTAGRDRYGGAHAGAGEEPDRPAARSRQGAGRGRGARAAGRD